MAAEEVVGNRTLKVKFARGEHGLKLQKIEADEKLGCLLPMGNGFEGRDVLMYEGVGIYSLVADWQLTRARLVAKWLNFTWARAGQMGGRRDWGQYKRNMANSAAILYSYLSRPYRV